LVVMLGVLIGTSSLGQAESGQIEPGKRIGPIALEMPVEEVVVSLGQPDRMATYSSAEFVGQEAPLARGGTPPSTSVASRRLVEYTWGASDE